MSRDDIATAFYAADIDGSQALSWDEFLQHLVPAKLQTTASTEAIRTLFDELEVSGDGTITPIDPSTVSIRVGPWYASARARRSGCEHASARAPRPRLVLASSLSHRGYICPSASSHARAG